MPWECKTVNKLREEFVAKVMLKEESMSSICRQYGISRTTGYKWVARYLDGETMLDKSHEPFNKPYKTNGDTEQMILSVRYDHPTWGARKIKRFLENKGQYDLPSVSTISNILKRCGCVCPEAAIAHTPYKRFEMSHPNDMWQMDYKGHFAMVNGERCHPLTMHALCDSVIVIDEVQTVPNEMLSLFNTAVNFLSEVCGATIVLCSATQPCLEQTAHPITENIKDIVPFDEELWRVFKRTQIIDKGGMRLDAIPAFIAEQLGTTDSLLVICNLKKQAAYLFTEMNLGNTVIFHLSAGMCMAHRMAVISEINSALERKRKNPDAPKVVCISTQVIEAGVDVSFGCVIRLCAGLDSVIQAAGRCNRNGELNGAADVFIINCRGEDLGMLRSIKDGKMACMSLLSDCKYHPEKYPSGLTSDEAVYAYYKKLYIQSDIGAQDMPIKIDGSPFTLFDLLSLDRTFANAPYLKANGEKYALTQAFKTAGSRFTVFGSSTTDVIVPYGEGKEIIVELGSKRAEEDIKYLKKLIKKARAYTVSLYENQRRALADSGALHPIADGIALALSEEFYNEAFGLNLDGESREAITL